MIGTAFRPWMTLLRWFAREGSSDAARTDGIDIVAWWQSLRRVMTKGGLPG